jgi:RHH-type proline utilization regulon transcriptional repressor/proline dehydrogenase/delta 1-pyrroline-5-carboxylate dehydrogenase
MGYLGRLVSRSGEPIIRQAMRHAMRIMGRQFVLGRTIGEALAEAEAWAERGYRFSFDMLGEAAVTMADADRYFDAYAKAIAAVAGADLWAGERGRPIAARPSISVKLSALHPRYEARRQGEVTAFLVERLAELVGACRDGEVGLTIDAEEQDRLDLGLGVVAALFDHEAAAGWGGLGLAVQAYGRRGRAVIDWIAAGARASGRRVPVRLVKGAYWDTEIKRAQVAGLGTYPVFTRKASTDVAYLACARAMLDGREVIDPQFATHNAQSVASILTRNGGAKGLEFQRLHGMGQALYAHVSEGGRIAAPCRVYAPVGSHEDLLAYLVRRLLENGANTSFVNRLADDEAPIREIVADPVATVRAWNSVPHPRIPSPPSLFRPDRANSAGILLTEPEVREPLVARLAGHLAAPLAAGPIVAGEMRTPGDGTAVTSPQDRSRVVGAVHQSTAADIDQALASAAGAFAAWDRRGGAARAEVLERAADLYEKQRERLMAVIIAEAGKTLDTALGDVREAADFLRYYAARAREDFDAPRALPGPTGEANQVSLRGRGVFACISPWNFPIAIFTGQIAGALAAGNAVVAKPAEQTPLVAALAVGLLHRAGVPAEALHLLPGDGAGVGGALVSDSRIAGIAFTGGTETARAINRGLAARPGPIVPLIAETGGLNAMIVDSTALPEQAVRDAVASAFDSAGQRCSALRVLCLQQEIAPRILELLAGAMAELRIGDPMDYATDIGPVIDEEARAALEEHKVAMRRTAKVICELDLPEAAGRGTFVAPAAYEIDRPGAVSREVFGPILHVLRYRADRLGELVGAINGWGYGLTLGVHSRIEGTAAEVAAAARVGNVYVNRNQIGAVVGAQPFGGEGLSGTGPKAGGPHYLHRFATERVVSTDTTASGGNASLLSLDADPAPDGKRRSG